MEKVIDRRSLVISLTFLGLVRYELAGKTILSQPSIYFSQNHENLDNKDHQLNILNDYFTCLQPLNLK